MHLITTDIYEGAYLLSHDMRLEKLWLNGKNGKRKVLFQFVGDNVEVLQKDYQKGMAVANVVIFKQYLNELKDRMFNLMREEDERRANYETKQYSVR